MGRLLLVKCMLCAVAGPALAVFGCATTGPADRPFSSEWRDTHRNERAFKNRMDRLRGGGRADDTDSGDGKLIRMDEQGRPRMRVGGDSGLSADVDYNGGPEAEIKYKVKWDFAKPERKD